MVEDNKINISDLYEICNLVSAEIKQLESSNLSIKKSIEKMEKRKSCMLDIEILNSSKKVYQLQSVKVQKLSNLNRKLRNLYLKKRKEG